MILVRAKEKRIRQNRRLRKSLIPKNAMVSLNELKGVQVGNFTINNEDTAKGGFSATVTVNGKMYVGHGPTKIYAKNDACENALREYVLFKLQQYSKNGVEAKSLPLEKVEKGTVDSDSMQCDVTDENCKDDKLEVKVNLNEDDEEENDEVPILNLASFALYKLYSQWEMEGYLVPELHPNHKYLDNGNNDSLPLKKKSIIRHELPDNWSTMHPTSLLHIVSWK